jgi:hypothetical protein
MDARFDELSRKAAAGTLAPDERAWLDAYLHEHPERRVDAEWDEAFGRQLERKVASMPPLPGWERTQRILDGERRPAAAPGLLDRVSAWLAQTLGVRFDAQAAAVALVLVQAVAIGVLAWPAREASDDRMRGGPQDATPRGPLLRVSFRDDVREADLRRVVAGAGAEIVGGPGQIGVYLLRVREGDVNAAATRLQQSGITTVVEVVRAP